jgi:hypothetical protein
MNGLHSCLVDPVDPPRAVRLVGYQSSLLEDLQVLRHRRPSDWQLRGELPDRHRPPREALEDGPPGRITQRAQRIYSVSFH